MSTLGILCICVVTTRGSHSVLSARSRQLRNAVIQKILWHSSLPPPPPQPPRATAPPSRPPHRRLDPGPGFGFVSYIHSLCLPTRSAEPPGPHRAASRNNATSPLLFMALSSAPFYRFILTWSSLGSFVSCSAWRPSRQLSALIASCLRVRYFPPPARTPPSSSSLPYARVSLLSTFRLWFPLSGSVLDF